MGVGRADNGSGGSNGEVSMVVVEVVKVNGDELAGLKLALWATTRNGLELSGRGGGTLVHCSSTCMDVGCSLDLHLTSMTIILEHLRTWTLTSEVYIADGPVVFACFSVCLIHTQ